MDSIIIVATGTDIGVIHDDVCLPRHNCCLDEILVKLDPSTARYEALQ